MLALPRWPYYKRKRRILARCSQGKVSVLLSSTRRAFLRSLSRSAIVLPLEKLLALALPKKWPATLLSLGTPSQQTASAPPSDLGVSFLNVARASGLNAKTIFGGEHKNKYLLETTGCGVAFYDNDGFDDLFVTYFGKNVLYHNNGNGSFTDVSEKAGVAGAGKRWNTGCAFVDYDRDGHLDLFVANYIDLDLKTAPVP